MFILNQSYLYCLLARVQASFNPSQSRPWPNTWPGSDMVQKRRVHRKSWQVQFAVGQIVLIAVKHLVCRKRCTSTSSCSEGSEPPLSADLPSHTHSPSDGTLESKASFTTSPGPSCRAASIGDAAAAGGESAAEGGRGSIYKCVKDPRSAGGYNSSSSDDDADAGVGAGARAGAGAGVSETRKQFRYCPKRRKSKECWNSKQKSLDESSGENDPAAKTERGPSQRANCNVIQARKPPALPLGGIVTQPRVCKVIKINYLDIPETEKAEEVEQEQNEDIPVAMNAEEAVDNDVNNDDKVNPADTYSDDSFFNASESEYETYVPSQRSRQAVIFDWDSMCVESEETLKLMGETCLAGGTDQPFYRVLLNDGSSSYVAQENLYLAMDPAPISNPLLGRYFSAYVKPYYIPNMQKAYEYPEDATIREQDSYHLHLM